MQLPHVPSESRSIDAAAAAGAEQDATSAPAQLGTRRTRLQANADTLDDPIAELFYGENLPDELADSERFQSSKRSSL